MPTSTFTLPDGSEVTLVPFPTSPVPKMIEPWVSDSVAVVTSVFTGQTQAQGASGADLQGFKLTYPPMSRTQAAPLRAWIRQMRGMARASTISPPDYPGPQGTPLYGAGFATPVISGDLVAGATTLTTRGWQPNTENLLLPDDLIQLSLSLYTVLDPVNSDSSGNASFEIFPSLRYDYADGDQFAASGGLVGLFRLAVNKRNWSVRTPNITDLSIDLVEYR